MPRSMGMPHLWRLRFLGVTAAVAWLWTGALRAAEPVAQGQDTPLVQTAGTLFSSGNPTEEEQLYLEYINRARRDPAGEAARIRASQDPYLRQGLAAHAVDLDWMTSQFEILPPAPPLAMNAGLWTAAEQHSQDMLDHAFEDHTGSDGSSVESRFVAQNYYGDALGENIYAFIHAVEDGHGAFEVDWSDIPTPSGMVDPPQHRLNLHDPLFQEVGIGVIHGTNGVVGPEVVTEDFGYRIGLPALITGVAYYDLDGDHFYSPGEGIGGVTVRVSGSVFYAITSDAGGFAVPVPSNGTYTVTFSAPNLADYEATVTITNGANAKVDYVPAFVPATVSGPTNPSVGEPNLYLLTPVGGAAGYEWKWSQSRPISGAIADAEAGLGPFVAATSDGYDVLDTNVVHAGQFSFHLAHPQSLSQVLTTDRVYRLGSEARLNFATRLGLATSNEVARVQISVDRGRSWQDVWIQPGLNPTGEDTFTTAAVELGAWAGRDLMLRFRYDVTGADYYSSVEPGYGWYFDDVTLSGAVELQETSAAVSAGTSFCFTPPAAGPYGLSVRPLSGAHALDWGPELKVVAAAGPARVPELRIDALKLLPDGHWQVDFTLGQVLPLAYDVQTATSPAGPWNSVPGVILEEGPGSGAYRALIPVGTKDWRFFRVVAR